MARFNKIFLGPVEKTKPQVQEFIASVAIKPGRLIVLSAGEWALAGATTVGKVWIAQDNYLAGKSVDDDWAADSLAIGMELLPDMLYAARVANGVNIAAVGTPLTPAASGTLAVAGASDLIIGHSEEVYNNNSGSEQLVLFRPGQTWLAAAA